MHYCALSYIRELIFFLIQYYVYGITPSFAWKVNDDENDNIIDYYSIIGQSSRVESD